MQVLPFFDQDNFEAQQLKTLIIKSSPKYIYGCNQKKKSAFISAWKFPILSVIALKEYEWITFNSPERVSFMIFDLDRKDKSMLMTLDDIKKETGNFPTWIMETARGYQFGYHLLNQVFTNQPKALRYLSVIKKEIVNRLGCDESGSMKNHGFMRNPLLSKNNKFTGIWGYELNDFRHLLPKVNIKVRDAAAKTKTVYNISKNSFVVGNRNNFLFSQALVFASTKELLTVDGIFHFLIRFQNSIDNDTPGLETNELMQISRSVFSLWKNKKIKNYIGKIEEKEKKMALPSIWIEHGRYLTQLELMEEIRKRQKLGASYTNENRDEKKLKKHLKKQNDKRAKTAKKKFNKVVSHLNKQNINVTQTSIVKHSKIIFDKGLSVSTVKKLLSEK